MAMVLLGIPVGIFLAKLCNEEVKAWKFRLKMVAFVAFFLGIVMFFLDFEYKVPVIIGFGFMVVCCLSVVWRRGK